MNEYLITVKNGGSCIIYNDIIKAKNEKEALKILIEKETIYSGDAIFIEEI